jgi:hypothetical protein
LVDGVALPRRHCGLDPQSPVLFDYGIAAFAAMTWVLLCGSGNGRNSLIINDLHQKSQLRSYGGVVWFCP